ncbi:MAG TPA: recombination-associated protein RdgC [Steroidobacteraceae bacterium]|jgi:recombination associated protein RdgC|nr:recombination-associated protein RdgC [Steroidobacteraceae bacterium]
MWFRNLVLYRLPPGWSLSSAQLEEKLGTRPLQACGALEMLSRGWVAPSSSGRLVHSLNQHHLIALGVDQKLLPASIVRQEALRRAKLKEDSQGFPVGKRQMRDLKLRVTEELRARALTRQRSTRAWIDPPGGWCVVDAASPTKAEELIEVLRDTLGTFAVQFVQTQRSAHASMAAWLTQGSAPDGLALDQDLTLTTADGTKASVRYTRHALDLREIRSHLDAGKYPAQLGLCWNDRVAFMLTEKLAIKRVQFLDLEPDADAQAPEHTATEIDPLEKFDADFALMTGELRLLLGAVVQSLGGEVPIAAAA